MGRKTIALILDEEIYKKYQKYYGDRHMIVSRKVEAFMKKELDEQKG